MEYLCCTDNSPSLATNGVLPIGAVNVPNAFPLTVPIRVDEIREENIYRLITAYTERDILLFKPDAKKAYSAL